MEQCPGKSKRFIRSDVSPLPIAMMAVLEPGFVLSISPARPLANQFDTHCRPMMATLAHPAGRELTQE